MSHASDNAAAFATADQATWLRQVDAGIRATADSYTQMGRHDLAWVCMGAHVARTEHTRVLVEGPPADIDTAWTAFLCAWDRQHPGQIESIRRLLHRLHGIGVTS